MIDALPDLDAYVTAFGEWVEACWFAEQDRTQARLEALLAFPPDVVLVGALWILSRLLELSDPRGLAIGDVVDDDVTAGPDLAGALAAHLIITGPDMPGGELKVSAETAATGGR